MVPQSPENDPLIGQVLDDRFEIRELIAQGGMGKVYLAVHLRLGRECVIKVLRRELLGDETYHQRLAREGRIAATLYHPNIVHVYDFGCTRTGEPFLVMERIP